jgi:signal transduction histidine kinase/CheY-like chemotaxis protein
MDLLLLFALIELLFRRIESLRPGPILLLAFATAVMIGTDFIVFGQTLQNTYDSGGLLDTGWIVAYLSFGLAGVLHANSPRIDLPIQGLKISNMQFSWAHLLPYISAAAAYVLLLWSYNNPLPLSFSYLSWGVGGIIGLIVIRQIAALRENESLYLEAKGAEEEVRRLNEQLEARVVERTKQLESANRKLQDEIQDRKRIEEDLRRAKDAAEVATNAKSQFLAIMSHELRTPMNAVIGLTGLLLRTGMTWEQRDYVQTIQSSGNALLSIINDVLDYSKIDNGKMELEIQPFNLKSCIEEARDLLASNAAEKGLAISYALDDGIPEVIMGDPARLRQILVNLLGNAVKFTSAGRIEIRITSKNLEDDLYEIHFAVTDTGIGIPQDKMSHLFQSFSQVDASTSRRYGGTGLGLAISKLLVELMGGRIWAESEAGIGSAFHFTILAKESSLKPVQSIKPAQRADTDTHDRRKNSLRILLAEDNMINQKVMLKMLNKLNYRADVAANGLEALAALESQPYDVVLMDIQMPEMDGWEAAKKIREKWPKWPKIFAVTAYAIQGDRETCMAAGMDDYITKPVKIEELQAVLESTADLADGH